MHSVFNLFLVQLCHRFCDTVQKSKLIKSHGQKLPNTFARKHFPVVVTGAGNGGIAVCYCLFEISIGSTKGVTVNLVICEIESSLSDFQH